MVSDIRQCLSLEKSSLFFNYFQFSRVWLQITHRLRASPLLIFELAVFCTWNWSSYRHFWIFVIGSLFIYFFENSWDLWYGKDRQSSPLSSWQFMGFINQAFSSFWGWPLWSCDADTESDWPSKYSLQILAE